MNASELRMLWQDESYLRRTTSSAPPLSSDVREVTGSNGRTYYDVETWEEPADRNGQNLSGELVALIGGIRADFTSYGPRHPIRRALAEWERTCRRRHRLPTWKDHRTPICGAMLRDVIEGGASVRWCAERYGLSWPRAERLILAGMNFVGARYERWEDEQTRLTMQSGAYTPP